MLCVKHFVVVEAFVINKLFLFAFLSVCISINFVFANKSNMYSRNVLFEKYFDCPVFKLSAPNSYCCNFNGRAVPWAFPLEFVCKSKVESRVESSA